MSKKIFLIPEMFLVVYILIVSIKSHKITSPEAIQCASFFKQFVKWVFNE